MNNEKLVYKSKINWVALVLIIFVFSWLFLSSPYIVFLIPVLVIIIYFACLKLLRWAEFRTNSIIIFTPFNFRKRRLIIDYSDVSQICLNGNPAFDPPSFSIYIKENTGNKKNTFLFNYEDDFRDFLIFLQQKKIKIIAVEGSSSKSIYKKYLS